MLKKIKKLEERRATPNPAKLRKLGDALLLVGTTITSAAIVEHYEVLAIIALVMTVVGRFLVDFYKPTEKKDEIDLSENKECCREEGV